MFTLEHMLEFWVNLNEFPLTLSDLVSEASNIPVTDGKTLLKRHSSSTQLRSQSAVPAISQLKGKAYWLFQEPITPDFL